jgi:microcystin-dependent protein
MPAHTHLLHASTEPGAGSSPEGAVPAVLYDPNGTPNTGYTGSQDTQMNPGVIGPTGGGTPFSITQPFLGLNFIIAVEGIYPSRS